MQDHNIEARMRRKRRRDENEDGEEDEDNSVLLMKRRGRTRRKSLSGYTIISSAMGKKKVSEVEGNQQDDDFPFLSVPTRTSVSSFPLLTSHAVLHGPFLYSDLLIISLPH